MKGTEIRSRVQALAEATGFTVEDESSVPPRQEKRSPIPELLEPRLRELLTKTWPAGLYKHQVTAIEHFAAGEDVCLATSTASGKSLAFIAAVANELLKNNLVRALALYPAKALIQDQLGKWREILEPSELTWGFIDGSVPIKDRDGILAGSRVVLMTPDVAHAWLMSRTTERHPSQFLQRLRAIVLDETHTYDGVFGTNMAYLMRRLLAAAGPLQIISSTATISDPADFIEQLTGRRPFPLTAEDDGAPSSAKSIFELVLSSKEQFEGIVGLIRRLAGGEEGLGRFLVFADSRKLVERLVAATQRSLREDGDMEGEVDESDEGEPSDVLATGGVLPYRAGYEEEDRVSIQRAFESGELTGVVSTSALELGIDIGDVRTVVLLGRPRSASSLWQRLGRAGRKEEGIGLIVQGRELETTSLDEFLGRSFEPNRLYLKNRYVQYAHALCAAAELRTRAGGHIPKVFGTLPPEFRGMLENEIHQMEAVAPDLYPLKQRAQDGPHREFPLRAAGEQSFRIYGPHELRLGFVSLGQALREAYPGAVYYYMARPFRVIRVHHRREEIRCKRSRHYTTTPLAQSKVFPRFAGGILQLWRSSAGFLAEVELQVSERVLGFTEQRGQKKTSHSYGGGSEYSQREMSRLFQTTGVCWWFEDEAGSSDATGQLLLLAFSELFRVHARDLGAGLFFSKRSPLRSEVCKGACVYDSTSGSLRLTKELAENFTEIVEAAPEGVVHGDGTSASVGDLERLAQRAEELEFVELTTLEGGLVAPEDGKVLVVASGEKAFLWRTDGQVEEVVIEGVRYTPQGTVYDLQSTGAKRSVSANHVQAIAGESRMARFDPMTGEVVPLEGEDIA